MAWDHFPLVTDTSSRKPPSRFKAMASISIFVHRAPLINPPISMRRSSSSVGLPLRTGLLVKSRLS